MFRKTHLDNGITVVMEQLRSVRSVSLGIWVKVGSRHETPEKSGISHFIEHMFFKGTHKRTAKDIAIDIDSIGGDLNAFTSKENTTFYTKVLDEYIDRAIEILSDIFLHSVLPEEEIEKEKGVIKEEIKMVEDTPDEYVHDLFSKTVWGDTGLGRPILGSRDTIKTFTRDDILNHIKKYYGTRDTVISCAGNFDYDTIIGLLNKHLGHLRRGSEPKIVSQSIFKPEIGLYQRDSSEAHICIGAKGIPQASPLRYAISILNAILGAGVSSRLFQEIREKRGLVYSIQSFVVGYLDTGIMGVYAGTSKKRISEVIELIVKEMEGLSETITQAELDRAKKQLKGNMILGLESTSGRMQNIARQEIYYGRYYSPEEIMKEIDSVSLSDVRTLARDILSDGLALTVLGPITKEKIISSLPALFKS